VRLCGTHLRKTPRVGITAAALIALAPRPAHADFFEEPPPGVSIYRVSPWINGAVILGTNAVTVGFYAFGGGLIDQSCPCNPANVNGFDRPTIGNHSDFAYGLATATVWSAVLVPVALDAWDLKRFRPLVEDATVLATALSISGALATVTKFTFQRPYPRTYAGDPKLVHESSGYQSFYSGHTTIAFTSLSVASMTIGRRYDQWVLPWIVTAVVGSSVAVELVLSGWHFPTDTIAGALVGTAVGIAVPAVHFTDLPVRPMLSVNPRGDGFSLSFVGTWP
jgi:membrane-associated phospholipid phosphatase